MIYEMNEPPHVWVWLLAIPLSCKLPVLVAVIQTLSRLCQLYIIFIDPPVSKQPTHQDFMFSCRSRFLTRERINCILCYYTKLSLNKPSCVFPSCKNDLLMIRTILILFYFSLEKTNFFVYMSLSVTYLNCLFVYFFPVSGQLNPKEFLKTAKVCLIK